MSFCRFRFVLSSFLQHPDLAFAEVLPEETIAQACTDAGVARPQKPAPDESIVYTPAVTLWAFLSQVLHKREQRSWVAAVARVVVLMAALSRDCSDNTGAYCRARARLPLVVIQRLAPTRSLRAERFRPDLAAFRQQTRTSGAACRSEPST